MKSDFLYAKLVVIAFMLVAIAATVAFPAKVILIGEGRLPCAAVSQQDERSSYQADTYTQSRPEKGITPTSADPYDVVPIDEYNKRASASENLAKRSKQPSRAATLCVTDVGVQIFRILAILAGGGVVLWGLSEYEKALLRRAKP